MTVEMLQIAGSLGVGALLGLIIFFCYRIDRRGNDKRMSALLEADQETREHNTRALTELTSYLRGLNGRMGGH